MFACLLPIRWLRRLRQLRRLTDATPTTRTRLPGPRPFAPPPNAVPPGLPEEFHPAAADAAELSVQAWLHHYVLHGCSPTTSAGDPNAAAPHPVAPHTQQEESDG
ncbi:hypothetical protein ACFCY8_10380 [Streptomyces noursei]|uniref:hypothetical protein n=1 Tax=Streptomyces noursei TaxID=1971 RepID=UPI0035D98CFC